MLTCTTPVQLFHFFYAADSFLVMHPLQKKLPAGYPVRGALLYRNGGLNLFFTLPASLPLAQPFPPPVTFQSTFPHRLKIPGSPHQIDRLTPANI
jgi:hypothetical protein